MVHSGDVLRSEDPARNLNNEVSELQARVAFPRHWSGGEHEQHIEKLHQLNFQNRLLINYGDKQSAPVVVPVMSMPAETPMVSTQRHHSIQRRNGTERR